MGSLGTCDAFAPRSAADRIRAQLVQARSLGGVAYPADGEVAATDLPFPEGLQ